MFLAKCASTKTLTRFFEDCGCQIARNKCSDGDGMAILSVKAMARNMRRLTRRGTTEKTRTRTRRSKMMMMMRKEEDEDDEGEDFDDEGEDDDVKQM